nr:uncharacterized protein LOC123749979 [Procambarus clarkii]
MYSMQVPQQQHVIHQQTPIVQHTTVVQQPQPVVQCVQPVVVVPQPPPPANIQVLQLQKEGDCPKCRNGFLQDYISSCSIILVICLTLITFIGFLSFFCLMRKKCPNCLYERRKFM